MASKTCEKTSGVNIITSTVTLTAADDEWCACTCNKCGRSLAFQDHYHVNGSGDYCKGCTTTPDHVTCMNCGHDAKPENIKRYTDGEIFWACCGLCCLECRKYNDCFSS